MLDGNGEPTGGTNAPADLSPTPINESAMNAAPLTVSNDSTMSRMKTMPEGEGDDLSDVSN